MKPEPILTYVLRHLRAARGQRRIAAETGVPYSTLTKIIQGRTSNPGVQHVQALYDYFQEEEQAQRLMADPRVQRLERECDEVIRNRTNPTDGLPPEVAGQQPAKPAAKPVPATPLAPTLGEPRLGSDRREDERRKPVPRVDQRRVDERRDCK